MPEKPCRMSCIYLKDRNLTPPTLQIAELEAEFENLPPGKPHQERFLRSQQDLKAKLAEQAAAGGDHGDGEDEVDEPAEEVDAFDLMEPVEILSKIPKDFYEKIVSSLKYFSGGKGMSRIRSSMKRASVNPYMYITNTNPEED